MGSIYRTPTGKVELKEDKKGKNKFSYNYNSYKKKYLKNDKEIFFRDQAAFYDNKRGKKRRMKDRRKLSKKYNLHSLEDLVKFKFSSMDIPKHIKDSFGIDDFINERINISKDITNPIKTNENKLNKIKQKEKVDNNNNNYNNQNNFDKILINDSKSDIINLKNYQEKLNEEKNEALTRETYIQKLILNNKENEKNKFLFNDFISTFYLNKNDKNEYLESIKKDNKYNYNKLFKFSLLNNKNIEDDNNIYYTKGLNKYKLNNNNYENNSKVL